MYLLSIEEMAGVGLEVPVPGETTPAAEAEFNELKMRIKKIIACRLLTVKIFGALKTEGTR